MVPGIGCMMIGYAVLTQITNVIDGETDSYDGNSRTSIASHGKMDSHKTASNQINNTQQT